MTEKKENRSGRKLRIQIKGNPLAYLGWLGVLGVLGLFFVPSLIPFLLCFTFFSYAGMTPDELFWKQVHIASTRAFWSVFAVDVIGMLCLFCRAMTSGGPYIQPELAGDVVTMGVLAWEQSVLAFLLLILNQTVMILVFSVSMWRFKRKEKKILAEQ